MKSLSINIKKYFKVEWLLLLFGISDLIFFLRGYSSTIYLILKPYWLTDLYNGFFEEREFLALLNGILIISCAFSAYGFLKRKRWAFILYYCQLSVYLYFLMGNIIYRFKIYKLYGAQKLFLYGVSIFAGLVFVRFIITLLIHKKYLKQITNSDTTKLYSQAQKGLIYVFVISIIIMSAYNIYKLIPRQHISNPVRPDNFPEILIVPKDAGYLDYSAPSFFSNRTKGVYSVSFIVDEPYPSDKVRKFYCDHFSSNGWQKLKYDLMNPKIPISKNIFFSDSNTILPDGTKGKWPLYCQEDWLNKDEQVVSVIFHYPIDPHTKQEYNNKPDLNKIYINMAFFDKKSWMNPYIKIYKQIHPEEFSK